MGCPHKCGRNLNKRAKDRGFKGEEEVVVAVGSLKGVSTYNDSKAEKPTIPTEVIEIGLSLALAVILVLGTKAVLKKVWRR